MQLHPYINMPATFGDYTGTIVHIGDTTATILLPDGSHKVAPLYDLKVDAAEAAKRLAPSHQSMSPLAAILPRISHLLERFVVVAEKIERGSIIRHG
jgi:hypothetical protein